NVDGFFVNDFAAGKGQRDLEAVPAFYFDFPTQVIRNRHDGHAGELGQGDDAVLDHVTGAARAVRSDGEVVAALGPGGEFAQGLRAAPAGRTAHGFHAETLQYAGEKSSVLAGADHRRQTLGLIAACDVTEISLHA